MRCHSIRTGHTILLSYLDTFKPRSMYEPRFFKQELDFEARDVSLII
jgi:hypothetical protein